MDLKVCGRFRKNMWHFGYFQWLKWLHFSIQALYERKKTWIATCSHLSCWMYQKCHMFVSDPVRKFQLKTFPFKAIYEMKKYFKNHKYLGLVVWLLDVNVCTCLLWCHPPPVIVCFIGKYSRKNVYFPTIFPPKCIVFQPLNLRIME